MKVLIRPSLVARGITYLVFVFLPLLGFSQTAPIKMSPIYLFESPSEMLFVTILPDQNKYEFTLKVKKNGNSSTEEQASESEGNTSQDSKEFEMYGTSGEVLLALLTERSEQFSTTENSGTKKKSEVDRILRTIEISKAVGHDLRIELGEVQSNGPVAGILTVRSDPSTVTLMRKWVTFPKFYRSSLRKYLWAEWYSGNLENQKRQVDFLAKRLSIRHSGLSLSTDSSFNGTILIPIENQFKIENGTISDSTEEGWTNPERISGSIWLSKETNSNNDKYSINAKIQYDLTSVTEEFNGTILLDPENLRKAAFKIEDALILISDKAKHKISGEFSLHTEISKWDISLIDTIDFRITKNDLLEYELKLTSETFSSSQKDTINLFETQKRSRDKRERLYSEIIERLREGDPEKAFRKFYRLYTYGLKLENRGLSKGERIWQEYLKLNKLSTDRKLNPLNQRCSKTISIIDSIQKEINKTSSSLDTIRKRISDNEREIDRLETLTKLQKSNIENIGTEMNQTLSELGIEWGDFLSKINPIGATTPSLTPKLEEISSKLRDNPQTYPNYTQLEIIDTTILDKIRSTLFKKNQDIETGREIIKSIYDINMQNNDSSSNIRDIYTIESLIETNDLKDYYKKVDELTNTMNEYDKTLRSLNEAYLSRNKLNLELDSTKSELSSARNSMERNNSELSILKSEYLSSILPQSQSFEFQAIRLEIEFSEGYIETIEIHGEILVDNRCDCFSEKEEDSLKKYDEVVFHNIAPIGFSRKMDFESLNGQILYTRTSSKKSANSYAIKLGDILTKYDLNLALHRRDFSPGNSVDGPTIIELEDERKKEHPLYKSKNYQLFEGQVFSDFQGLNGQNPNGIFQLRATKRINIITQRYPGRNPFAKWLYRAHFPYGNQYSFGNYGFISFIEPYATISKVEKNLRDLPISSKEFGDGSGIQIPFVSTLDLKRHEQVSAGIKLNTLLWDWPTLKSTLTHNVYGGFGNVSIVDSSETFIQSDDNKSLETTFQFGHELRLSILPEERYSLFLSYGWNFFYLSSNLAEQVANKELFAATGENMFANRFNTMGMEIRIVPNVDSNSKLFLRLQFSHQQRHWNTNFLQIQGGYSFYLLGRYN